MVRTLILLFLLQSPTLSGTTWYDLSSVEVGLIVSALFALNIMLDSKLLY